MIEPVCRLQEWRTGAHRRISDLGPVADLAKSDLLRPQRLCRGIEGGAFRTDDDRVGMEAAIAFLGGHGTRPGIVDVGSGDRA
jgi:hypothetical protein